MKFVSLFFLFYGLVSLEVVQAKDSDTIKCKPGSEQDVIYTLFATVKNDILGTIPRFCRPEKYKQFQEQIDPDEEALSQFVDKLTKSKQGKLDKHKIDITNEKALDKQILEFSKIIILKKLWLSTPESDRYDLMISDRCASLGLNRFPIHEKPKNQIVREGIKKQVENVCEAIHFAGIAPFLTKENLAELLLHLKTLYPESFPALVGNLCGSIAETDEAIFKNSETKDYFLSDRPLQTVADFDEWLEQLFKESEETQFESGDLYSDPFTMYGLADAASMKKAYKDFQTQLGEKFKKFSKGEPSPEGVIDPGNPYYILKQDNKGLYYYEKSAQMKELEVKQVEQTQKMQNEHVKLNIASLQNTLKNEWLLGKGDLDPEKGVKMKNFPDFLLKKSKDGKFYYEMAPEKLAAVQKKIDEVLDGEEKKLKSSKVQKKLKEIYEVQEEFTPSGGVMMWGYPKVVKKEDGTYDFPSNNQKNLHEYAQLKVKAFAGPKQPNVPIIESYDANYVLIMTKNNEPKYVPMSKLGIKSNINEPYVSYRTTTLLGDEVKKNYQRVTTDYEKLKELDSDKKDAVVGYTGSDYYKLNSCLRKDSCTNEEKERVNSIIEGLNAIRKNDPKNEAQVLFRGTKGLPQAVLDGLNSNAKNFVLDKGFMSTTGDINVAKTFSGYMPKHDPSNPLKQALFIMKTKSCVGISPISQVKSEDEFLCPPGMKFNVKRQGEAFVYVLEEVQE